MKNIILYRCRNCGGAKRILDVPGVREFVLSCTGQLEVIHVLRPFEDGEKGVCLVHCDPAKCQTLEGSAKALRRMKQAGCLLEEAGVNRSRLFTIRWEPGCDLKKEIYGFIENIKEDAGK
jgi:F420-non-reducing hydrogenase iron-sulfur subunit